MAITAAQCHVMTTYFLSKVSEVTGSKPTANRNKARWGFEAILMDYSEQETKDMIDFYVAKYEQLSLDWFFYNYDRVVSDMQEAEEEKKNIKLRREETQRRVEKWRNRWNQQK